MLCRNPFIKAGAAFPCGNCEPCRFNRKRLWAHRIMLENLCHKGSTFATLTYRDEDLPKVEGIPVLVPKHLQDWLKRFREGISPVKIRYFGVGEYGDRNSRPHYHVIVFGYPNCDRGSTLTDTTTGGSRWMDCCDSCRYFGSSWGFGDIYLGAVTKQSAGYCAHYTVKKMTKHDDVRLNGRHPEFCRMSLRPGIGADAMWEVASTMLQYRENDLDVPTALDYGKQSLPLGRYLRDQLRLMIGREKGAPDAVIEGIKEELRPVREAAFDASRSFKAALVEEGSQAVANINARNAVYKKERKL